MNSKIEYVFGRGGMKIMEYLITEIPDKEFNQMDIMSVLRMSHLTVQRTLGLFVNRGYILKTRKVRKSQFYSLICSSPVVMAIEKVISELKKAAMENVLK